jgi:hypothetical protein
MGIARHSRRMRCPAYGKSDSKRLLSGYVIAENWGLLSQRLRDLFAMLNRLKAIAAVYVGIYLILPGCLCQILAAFGLSSEAARYADTSDVVTSISSNTSCHCHEISDKAVELAMAEGGLPEVSQSTGEKVFAETARPPISLQSKQAYGRAPPDRVADASHALRYFTGVFLI